MNKKSTTSKLIKITIDSEKCKGCELCIPVCPTQNLEISEHSNSNGLFPAQTKNNQNNLYSASNT